MGREIAVSSTQEIVTFEGITPGSGPETILLLHGFPADAVSWEPVAAKLIAAGYRVLALRQRGYTVKSPPNGRHAYTINKLVQDVVARMDALNIDRTHLVGHDLGGLVAWAFASKHPERLLSLTVISAPHPRAFRTALFTSNQLCLSWYMLFFQIPLVPEWYLARRDGLALYHALDSSGLNHQAAMRYMQQMLHHKAKQLRYALHWYRAIPLSFRTLRRIDGISPNTLFIYGTHDPYLSAKAARVTSSYLTGNYRVKRLEDQGHWIPEESPALLAELLLAFLIATQAHAKQGS